MILAKLNQPEFEYDIHSLIKAFFPEENVSATAEDKKYEEEITLPKFSGRFFRPHGNEKRIETEFLSDIIRDHGQKASVGDSDRNPANENPDEIFRGRKNGGRDQSLHAKNVLCIR